MNPISDSKRLRIKPYLKRFEFFLSFTGAWILTYILFFMVPLSENSTVQFYIQMAENPYEFIAFPYGSRLLTPMFVFFLPYGVNEGFRIIAFIGFWLTGAVLYFLIRIYCSSIVICFGLLSLFYLTPTLHFLTANAWFIDPLSYLFLCATFFGAMYNQKGIATAALTLGVCNRPSSILYLPVALLLCWSSQTMKKNILQSIMIIFPACICFYLIIFVWPHASIFDLTKNTSFTLFYNNPNEVNVIFDQQGFMFLFSPVIYKELLPCIWGVILIGILHCKPKLLIACLLTALLSIIPMIAATDYFRLPFYSFPALFIFSAIGFEQLHELHKRVSYFWIVICGLVMVLYPQSLIIGFTVSLLIFVNYFILNRSNTIAIAKITF